ncbi:MAG: hypothetical protein WCV81_00350 [Microgenomates group bacterium]|jgi:hypothetical protein
MEITTRTIILAVVSVVIIALILSGVFYLLRSSKQLANTNKNTGNPLEKLGVITASPTPTSVQSGQTSGVTSSNNQPSTVAVNIKTYQGSNFTIKYPQNWGILTCSDSKNIELDPYNSNDLINYACDRAIKPITIIVGDGSLSCPGEAVKIGNNTVVRSKTETANWFKNRWCINKNGMSFDITNRINSKGIVGTGKDDFSSEIEKTIGSL